MEYGSGNGLAFGVEHLAVGGRYFVCKLRIMELMSAILLAVEHETAISQREFAVGGSCRNGVGQDVAHGIFAAIGNDALAKIHHAAALGNYASALFSKLSDGFAAGFVADQRLQMLLRIASGQIEHVDAGEVGYFCFRVKKADKFELVDNLLIDEGKCLGIPRGEDSEFTPGKLGV